MDFELTEEQRLLQRNARAFMEREIIPHVDEYERYRPLPKEITSQLIRNMVPLGYVVGTLPEEYGGGGLDNVSYGVLAEELCRAYASLGLVVMVHGMVAQMVLGADKELVQKSLKPMMSGDKIGCLAVTEPNVGSNPKDVETTATLDGDDYIINGTKIWITNGTVADLAIVLAATVEKDGSRTLSHFIVDIEDSPFSRRDLPKLGLRSCPTAELIFEDCRIPRRNVLGAPGAGLKATLKGFELPRAHLAIAALGIAQAAIDASIAYVKQRHQFGRPIGSFQLIQEMIADMVAEADAARFLSYRALAMIDKGVRCSLETSMAKFFATEAAVKIASKAIQIHGAYGLSEEFPLERYFRDARSLTIPDGTTQIQKLIVGRDVLGLQAFI